MRAKIPRVTTAASCYAMLCYAITPSLKLPTCTCQLPLKSKSTLRRPISFFLPSWAFSHQPIQQQATQSSSSCTGRAHLTGFPGSSDATGCCTPRKEEAERGGRRTGFRVKATQGGGAITDRARSLRLGSPARPFLHPPPGSR